MYVRMSCSMRQMQRVRYRWVEADHALMSRAQPDDERLCEECRHGPCTQLGRRAHAVVASRQEIRASMAISDTPSARVPVNIYSTWPDIRPKKGLQPTPSPAS